LKEKIAIILLLSYATFLLYSEQTHTLKAGETIYSLSKYYNVSTNDIINLNKISDLTSIKVGTKILIPDKTVENFNTITSEKKKYVVKEGDTLFSISKQFNIPLSELMVYNNLSNESLIAVGQILNLSEGNTDLPEVALQPEESIDESFIPKDNIPYWPVNGSIRNYSGRIQGVEIVGNSGDYIQAVSNGRVIWYDSFKGIGKVVLIEGDNGFDYLYGTKDDLNVKMGLYVSAGERLGRLKDNSNSLVFSVFKNGKPLSDLSKAPR